MSANNIFNYEVIKQLGVLTDKDKSGFSKEINLISFNGKAPVIDIRNWTPQGTMSKGVTLSYDAFKKLIAIGTEYIAQEESK